MTNNLPQVNKYPRVDFSPQAKMSDQDDSDESVSYSQSLILDLPPSCIEFCPAHPSYFLVGTYNLQKEEYQKDEGGDGDDDNNEPSGNQAKQPQSRNGSIIVFQLREGKVSVLQHRSIRVGWTRLTHTGSHPIQTLPQPSAVFDLHFQPHHHHGQQGRGDVCATVSSTGTISFFRLMPPVSASTPDSTTTDTTSQKSPETGDEVSSPLQQLSVLRIPHLDDDDVLFTFFAWHPTITGLMAITTAAGSVVLVRINEDYQGLDVLEESLMEHDGLEAWCIAFSQPYEPGQEQSSTSSSPFTIFSGGDDSKLRYTLYDTAAPASSSSDHNDGEEEEDTVVNNNNRIPYPPISLGNHEAGVTFILPLPIPIQTTDGPHLVATGSYDESLRLWKIAPLDQTCGMRKATCLAEKSLGGGVWRLNILDTKTFENGNGAEGGWEALLLASCMHAGSRILQIRRKGDGEGKVQVNVLARFEEHKSMNYGSDWFRGEGVGVGEGGRVVCVSTSFYDRLLCVWTFRRSQNDG